MIRSYSRLAEDLGLKFCGGVTAQGSYCQLDHARWGAAETGRVHMADVRVTKAGIARFLKLAAQALDPTLAEDEPWRRIYRINLASRELAKRLHVRVPGRSHYEYDRAFVRASVAGLSNSVPMREAAFDWARR